MKLENLEQLFVEGLRDLYYAEHQSGSFGD
jgi:hypothetical protein